MTEAEWLKERHHSQRMVWALGERGKVTRTKVGRRKLRLFACGCCRLIWELVQDPRLRSAVETAERFAEGQATKEELEAARALAQDSGLTRGGYTPDAAGVRERTAAAMALATAHAKPMEAAFSMTTFLLPLAGYNVTEETGEAALCDLLRCVFGNPFQPLKVARNWLKWNTSTVPRVALAISEERGFDRLPILADALEEAGCNERTVLDHLRSPGPHVLGCHVVDALLGKQ